MQIALGMIFWLALQTGSPVDQIRDRMGSGDMSGAEAALTQALAADATSWELLALLGELRARQQRWQEAETALNQALELASQRVEPYLQLSRLYLTMQRFESAEEILQRARSRLGEDPQLLHLLALVSVQQRDLVKALAWLARIPDSQTSPEYWETLGRVQASLGSFAEAERAYQQLLERRPGSIAVLRSLAGFALKQGESERAWQYMSQARRLAPNSPDVLSEFTQVSLNNGLIGEALACARLLLLLEPDNRDYRIILARTLMAANEHNEATKHLKTLLEEHPEDGEGHLLMGVALNRLGEFGEAQRFLETARQHLPEETEARYILGLVAYNRTQDEEALSHLRSVLERKPQHGGAWLALGKLQQRQELWPEALSALQKAAEFLPGDADVHFQLSRVHRQLGNNSKAQTAVARYRELKQLQEERDIRAATLPYTRPDPP